MSAELDSEMVELLATHYGIEINMLEGFEQLTQIYTEMRGEGDVWESVIYSITLV